MAIIPFFSQYPYTNLEQLNIDGLIRELGILHKDIQDEATAREEADQAEATAREAADQVLDDKITAEAKTRYHDINELITNLNAEADAREAADQVLDNKITAEATARAAADQELDNKITAEAETRYHDINELITDYNALDDRVEKLEPLIFHVSPNGVGGYDVAPEEAPYIPRAVDPEYNVIVIFTQMNMVMTRNSIYTNGTEKTAYFEFIGLTSSADGGTLAGNGINIKYDSSTDLHTVTLTSVSIDGSVREEINMTSDSNTPDSSATITTADYTALNDSDLTYKEFYINLTLPNTNKMVYKRIGVNYSNVNAQDIYLLTQIIFMNDLKHSITVEIDKTDDPYDPAEWSYSITGEVLP